MPTLYVDLDDVFADVAGYYQARLGDAALRAPVTNDAAGIQELVRTWELLHAVGDYREVPWTGMGERFWTSIRRFAPVILTAAVPGTTMAERKQAWVAAHLDPMPPVIGQFNKALRTATGDVLVDNDTRNQATWAAAGGVFIQLGALGPTLAAIVAAMK